jgi:hypothetical protein
MITKKRLLEIVGDSAVVKQSIWHTCCPFCVATKAEIGEMAQKLLSLPADWTEDSSLETWFPFTAEELKRIKEENEEYKESFDLRWKADMRAIKMWQKDNPGNDLVWPDHADLVVWLMGQLKEKRKNEN